MVYFLRVQDKLYLVKQECPKCGSGRQLKKWVQECMKSGRDDTFTQLSAERKAMLTATASEQRGFALSRPSRMKQG